MKTTAVLQALLLLMAVTSVLQTADLVGASPKPWAVYDGFDGPGKGKRIVLISGDEEYRSEELMPQLGKILAVRHGFTCTVLFAVDKKTGCIDPNTVDNIPGLEALQTADLMILFTRFRSLPDGQMKHIVDYINSGRPIIGLRTATHAFKNQKGAYRKWSAQSNEPHFKGGFGRVILGEKWISHHGRHGKESTRGIIAPAAREHPITRGIRDGDIWGPSDVYAVRLPLPEGCRPIVMGQVLKGMKPDDAPVEGGKNDPVMPVGWTRIYTTASGKKSRVFATTMGASQDFSSAGVRRMIVNGVYWSLDMSGSIPGSGCRVDLVGRYDPTPFGFGGFKRNVRPRDHRIASPSAENR